MALGLLALADVAVPGFFGVYHLSKEAYFTAVVRAALQPTRGRSCPSPSSLELQLRLRFPCLECYGLALPAQSHTSATRAYAPKSSAV